MKLASTITTCFLLFTAIAFAQVSPGTVEGRVNDMNNNPVAFATVTLLKSSDSVLVKGALTDSLGNYVIENVPAGSYMVAAANLGMARMYSEPVQVTNGEKVSVKTLQLQGNAKNLKEVKVNGMKPLFEQKPGMMVVNVEGSITSTGSSAMDVLKKSPGINVDNDDNISLKGKTGVLVLIDDKPTYLSSADLATMLKNLPANALSTIELMTTPPAKYDAAGTAGIINIHMKKNTNYGLNGSFTAMFKEARYPFYYAGTVMNYRTKKINLFGLYNYSDYRSYHNISLTRRYYNADTLNTIFKQFRPVTVSGHNHVVKAGFDYFINPRNTLGVIVTGLYNNDNSNVTNYTDINNSSNVLQSRNISDILYHYKFYNTAYDINYKCVFDSAGTNLTWNADYAHYNNTGTMDFNTNYLDAEGNVMNAPSIWAGNQGAGIDIASFKADFTHPMKGNMKLQAGIKGSYVTSDNNLFFQDKINGKWVVDTGITNHFKYTENINAAYIDISKAFKGFSVDVGLRGEQTIAQGRQLTNDSVFNKNYFQLFPTVFISKPLNKDNELSFSYSRRLDRPNYQDLNPFRYYVDPLTYRVGNTRLNPQYTHNLEISHVYKGRFVTTLDVSQVRGVMTDIIKQDDATKATIQYKDNINTQNTASLSFSLPFQVSKWWQSSNSLMFVADQYKGTYLGSPLNNRKLSFEAHSQNDFVLPYGIIGELSGFYRSGGVYAALDEASSYSVSAGIKKSFWNKRASLKIDVNDIFYTDRFKGTIHFENINIDVQSRWESRELSIAFTYQFGNKNVRSIIHRNGIEEEQGRVKKAAG